MFIIKAFAEPGSPKTVKGQINRATGVSRRQNPQSAVYLRDGYSVAGATRKTRGVPATARQVR